MKTIQIDNMTYIQDPADHQFYRLSPEDARKCMSFKRAVKHCRDKYSLLDGRSRRSEFWWFSLFSVLVLILPMAISVLLTSAFDGASDEMELLEDIVAILMVIVTIATALLLIVPLLSVMTRRLHDVGRSGWWVFGCIASGVAALFVFSLGFSYTGIDESMIHLGFFTKLKAIYESSVPLFAVVSALILSHLSTSLAVFCFTLLDSHKGKNKYGTSPKYPQPTENG